MPTPRTLNGVLTTGQVALYRVPSDRYAVVTALTMMNVSGATATGSLFLRTRGGVTQIVGRSMTALSTNTNDFALGSERWVLEPDSVVEGLASAANAITWAIMLLEFKP
jgi:hypothetical protein